MYKLAFLGRARSLGFSIEECRALLALYSDEDRASEVRQLAETHLKEIDRKIAELQGMRATLAHLIHRCHGDDRPHCPIRDDLAGEDGAAAPRSWHGSRGFRSRAGARVPRSI
jgi:DNA-binding transcriptional MerR regulator